MLIMSTSTDPHAPVVGVLGLLAECLQPWLASVRLEMFDDDSVNRSGCSTLPRWRPRRPPRAGAGDPLGQRAPCSSGGWRIVGTRSPGQAVIVDSLRAGPSHRSPRNTPHNPAPAPTRSCGVLRASTQVRRPPGGGEPAFDAAVRDLRHTAGHGGVRPAPTSRGAEQPTCNTTNLRAVRTVGGQPQAGHPERQPGHVGAVAAGPSAARRHHPRSSGCTARRHRGPP